MCSLVSESGFEPGEVVALVVAGVVGPVRVEVAVGAQGAEL